MFWLLAMLGCLLCVLRRCNFVSVWTSKYSFRFGRSEMVLYWRSKDFLNSMQLNTIQCNNTQFDTTYC